MPSDMISSEEAKRSTVDILLEKLSATKEGLTSTEAAKRLQIYGYNQITEKKKSLILNLLSYFWGPIPWMCMSSDPSRQKCLN